MVKRGVNKKFACVGLIVLLLVCVVAAEPQPLNTQLPADMCDYDGDGKKSVIIHYKEQPNIIDKIVLMTKSADIKASYDEIPAIACDLSEAEIDKMRNDPKVDFIEDDVRVVAFAQETPWGVNYIKADVVQIAYATGDGVKVGVIDTGVDYTHPELAAAYKGGYDYVNGDSDPRDDHGHGTHVAGIIVAADNGEGVVGVAPDADLYAIKALDQYGYGSLSDIISAIGWCVDHDIDVITMSLGTTAYSPSLEAACLYAQQQGCTLVAAAGNIGDGNPETSEIVYPAAFSSVVAVGALDSSSNVPSWSATGAFVEQSAPGVSIYSTMPTYQVTYTSSVGLNYGTMSGTSMACPHVAGAIVLLKSAHATYDENDLRYVLAQTATDLGDAGRDTAYGYGATDTEKAVIFNIPSDGAPDSDDPEHSGDIALYWEIPCDSLENWKRIGRSTNSSVFAHDGSKGIGTDLSPNQKSLSRYVYFPGSQTTLEFWVKGLYGGSTQDFPIEVYLDGDKVADVTSYVGDWHKCVVDVVGYSEGIHEFEVRACWLGDTREHLVGMHLDTIQLYADANDIYPGDAALGDLLDYRVNSQGVTAQSDPTLGFNIMWADDCEYDNYWWDYNGGWYSNKFACAASHVYSGTRGFGTSTTVESHSDFISGFEREVYFPHVSSDPGRIEVMDYYTRVCLTSGAALTENWADYEDIYLQIDGVNINDQNEDWLTYLSTPDWVHVQWTGCTGYHGFYNIQVISKHTDAYDSLVRASFDQLRFYADGPNATFDANVVSGAAPLTVEFDDDTVWGMRYVSDGDGIDSYDWNFGDGYGLSGSTDDTPSHTYNYAGTYDVSMTVYTSWGASDSYTRPGYITVGAAPEPDPPAISADFTATPRNGTSPLTVSFSGSTNGTATDYTYQWTFGDGDAGYGQTASHTYYTYGANQSYTVQLQVYNNTASETETKTNYINVTGQNYTSSGGVGTYYAPHQVRLIFQDEFGNPLPDCDVTAIGSQTTGAWDWITSFFGFPEDVDVQHYEMNGTSGTDGAIVFMMVENVKYQIDIDCPSLNVTTVAYLYPLEDEYVITVHQARQESLSENIDYELTVTDVDGDTKRLGLTYLDATNDTTSVYFYVANITLGLANSTTVYSTTVTGDSNFTVYYDVDYVGGEVYAWGFDATHGTFADFGLDNYVRIESTRPAVDFATWIPLLWYNWASVGIIFAVGSIFGVLSTRFGAVITPAMGAFFVIIGWLTITWSFVAIALPLGVVFYMRWSEGESGI